MTDHHPITIGGILLALLLVLAALVAFNVCGCGSDAGPSVAIADGGQWTVRCRATDSRINATLYDDTWLEVRDGGHRLHAGVAVVDFVTRTAFLPGGAAGQYLSLLRWDNSGGGTLTFGDGQTFEMDCRS